ncbi:ribulose-phosphate 3-epimerase [Buchnera aphidicola]|uniref:ribulose-phosphate 3-epimerase n=1 Tax=Buchnera aphidicola TaxID=9 RepID=UPI0030ED4A73
MRKIFLAPSILSANFYKLGNDIEKTLLGGGDIIHFDIMDNHYVSNLTFGPLVLSSLRKNGIKSIIDVHIMAKPVDRLIYDCIKFGANFITIHSDSTIHLNRSLKIIRDHGCKAGIAINPAQSLNFLEYIMDSIDLILVMTVNPGYSEQIFINEMLPKIKKIRSKIDNSNFKNILLSVDGGIKKKHIKNLVKIGVDIIVMGSEIFKKKDIYQTTKNIKKILINYSKNY